MAFSNSSLRFLFSSRRGASLALAAALLCAALGPAGAQQCYTQPLETCQGHVSASASCGEIHDGSTPQDDYKNGVDCSWSVGAPAGAADALVHLHLRRFDLESSSSCHYDYLEIKAGEDGRADELDMGRLCGPMASLKCTHGQCGVQALLDGVLLRAPVNVTFHADSSRVAKGFALAWESVPLHTGPDTVSSVLPASVLATGGTELTFAGANFDQTAAYTCSLGFNGDADSISGPATWVSPSELRCAPPAAAGAGGTTAVFVYRDGSVVLASASSGNPVAALTVEVEEAWTGVSGPTTGSVVGGTSLVVAGAGFSTAASAAYWCHFEAADGTAAAGRAVVTSGSSMECLTPEWPVSLSGPVVTSLSLNRTDTGNDGVVSSAAGAAFTFTFAPLMAGECAPMPPPSPSSPSCSGLRTLPYTCGALHDGSGLTSPYSPDVDCAWTLSPPTPSLVRLRFTSVHVEPSQTDGACGDDLVSLRAADGTPIVSFCGDYERDTGADDDDDDVRCVQPSSGGYGCADGLFRRGDEGFVELAAPFQVHFQSDDSVHRLGWTLNYTSVPLAPGGERWLSVTPTRGSALGGTTLTVLGSGFDSGRPYSCVFGDHSDALAVAASSSVPATVASPVSLTCKLPPGTGLLSVRVYQGSTAVAPPPSKVPGTDRDSPFLLPAIFDYAAIWSAVVGPSTGPTFGGSALSVVGSGFSADFRYQCVFRSQGGDSFSVAVDAAVASASALVCTTPAWAAAPGPATLEIVESGLVLDTTLTGGFIFTFAQPGPTDCLPPNPVAETGPTCTGQDRLLTAPCGTLHDGSADAASYSPDLNCSWVVHPHAPAAALVRFKFTRFSVDAARTSECRDKVVVYAGTPPALVGTYCGTTAAPRSSDGCYFDLLSGRTYSAPAPVRVVFETYRSVNAASRGWEIEWSSSVLPPAAGEWTSLLPSAAAAEGGDTVTLSGHGFDAAAAYTCVFGTSVEAPAAVVSDTEVTCGVPAHASGGNVPVRLRLGPASEGQEVTPPLARPGTCSDTDLALRLASKRDARARRERLGLGPARFKPSSSSSSPAASASSSTAAAVDTTRLIVRINKGHAHAAFHTEADPVSALSVSLRARYGALRVHAFNLIHGLEVWELPAGAGSSADVATEVAQDKDRVVYAEPVRRFSVPAPPAGAGYKTRAATPADASSSYASGLLPNDTELDKLWGMHNTGQTGGQADADIDAAEAWNYTVGSHDIIVAVIDTGIDYNHPDLQANIWTNPGEIPGNGIDDDGNGFVDDVHGYDFVNEDGDPMDDNAHGTHCAGTIGGVGNNGLGVVGVNWKVRLMALKFLSGEGSGTTVDAMRSVEYAVRMGARVTSNSYGGQGPDSDSPAFIDMIRVAEEHNQLFVCAAGNDNADNDQGNHEPSNYPSPNLIAVAATTHTDGRASFSSYGATTVDLGAPGEDIYSTTPGSAYRTFSGTSMACPHVAGAAALVWSTDPSMPWHTVRDRLLQGVDPIQSMAGKTVTGGRLNVARSVDASLVPRPPTPFFATVNLILLPSWTAATGPASGSVNGGDVVAVSVQRLACSMPYTCVFAGPDADGVVHERTSASTACSAASGTLSCPTPAWPHGSTTVSLSLRTAADDLELPLRGDGFNFSYVPPPDGECLADRPGACTRDSALVAMCGTLSDGSGASSNYGANEDCSWTIHPTSGSAVTTVRLDSVSYEEHPECDFDYVEIFAGAHTALVGKWCGDGTSCDGPCPAGIFSDGVALAAPVLVRHHTDKSVHWKGFALTWNSSRLSSGGAWEAMAPSLGPTTGGTVVTLSGNGFAASGARSLLYRCHFGDVDVPAAALSTTTITCTSPPRGDASPVPFMLYHDGLVVQPPSSGSSFDHGVFEYVPTWHTVVGPTEGYSWGGDALVVQGDGFVLDALYSCLFTTQDGTASASSAAAAPVDSSTVACTTPHWPHAAPAATTLTLLQGATPVMPANGVAASFTFSAPPPAACQPRPVDTCPAAATLAGHCGSARLAPSSASASASCAATIAPVIPDAPAGTRVHFRFSTFRAGAPGGDMESCTGESLRVFSGPSRALLGVFCGGAAAGIAQADKDAGCLPVVVNGSSFVAETPLRIELHAPAGGAAWDVATNVEVEWWGSSAAAAAADGNDADTAPVVTHLTPRSAEAGDTVTVFGANLGSGPADGFDCVFHDSSGSSEVASPVLSVAADGSSLTCIVPPLSDPATTAVRVVRDGSTVSTQQLPLCDPDADAPSTRRAANRPPRPQTVAGGQSSAGRRLLSAAPDTATAHPSRVFVRRRLGSVALRTATRAMASLRADLRASVRHASQIVDGLEVWDLGPGWTSAAAVARHWNDPRVEYVEPVYRVGVPEREWNDHVRRARTLRSDSLPSLLATPNDPQLGALWGMHNTGQTGGQADADIDAAEAWDISTGSRDVVIAVIDTGVDYNHPDLQANIWTNPGEIPGNGIDDDGNGFVDDVHGYDFANNDGDPMDDNAHGTHCAGTIGGVGNNGLGVVGVNWKVSIMALKFLTGEGSGDEADAARAIEYAVQMKARVTSNSWGGPQRSNSLEDTIKAAMAADQLFVCAAGNDNSDNDQYPTFPASYSVANIITVAATDHADDRSSFSNYGASSVHIGGPGTSILSTVPGNAYKSFSGTSMATPHVAGCAALLLARAPATPYPELKDLLLTNVDRIPSMQARVTSNGRVNIHKALQAQYVRPTRTALYPAMALDFAGVTYLAWTHASGPLASPSSGPSSGGTPLTVHGYRLTTLPPAARCVFTAVADATLLVSAPVVADSDRQARCTTPAWPHASATTTLSLDLGDGSPVPQIGAPFRFVFAAASLPAAIGKLLSRPAPSTPQAAPLLLHFDVPLPLSRLVVGARQTLADARPSARFNLRAWPRLDPERTVAAAAEDTETLVLTSAHVQGGAEVVVEVSCGANSCPDSLLIFASPLTARSSDEPFAFGDAAAGAVAGADEAADDLAILEWPRGPVVAAAATAVGGGNYVFAVSDDARPFSVSLAHSVSDSLYSGASRTLNPAPDAATYLEAPSVATSVFAMIRSPAGAAGEVVVHADRSQCSAPDS